MNSLIAEDQGWELKIGQVSIQRSHLWLLLFYEDYVRISAAIGIDLLLAIKIYFLQQNLIWKLEIHELEELLLSRFSLRVKKHLI